jgi:glycosyltransferase involved in cell wall biosynthesis
MLGWEVFQAMSVRRVLHVIDSLHLGGAQEVVLNLATCGSSRFRHEVATLHGRGIYWDRLREAGVPVHSLSPHKYFPLYLATLPWLIARTRPDILHCHLIPSNILAKPLGALLGVPLIINHDHTNDPHRIDNKGLLALDKTTNRLAHHIVAVAGACRDFLIEHEGVPPEKITLVPNAIDLRRFSPGTVTRSASRAALGLTGEGPVVAGVGRLNPQKNFSLFLEIAALLAPEFPEVRFLLAGEGPEESMLRAKVRELGLGDRVVFAGYVADTRRVYVAADVLLMPSRFEGLPMTLLEAMAMGLPVVASRLDGIAEVVEDGKEGFLVDAGDGAGFADRVARVLGSEEVASSLAAAARAKIEAGFSVERMTSAVEEIYGRFF